MRLIFILVLILCCIVLLFFQRNKRPERFDDNEMNTVPIYVINLERRQDRRKKMDERLGSHPNVVFMKAVDANEPGAQLIKVGSDRKFKRGEVACYTSHVNAWKEILGKRHHVAIVLEDDAVLELDKVKEVIKNFVNAWSDRPAKPLLGLLGLNNTQETTLVTHRPNGAFVGRLTHSLMGSQAYMLGYTTAAKLLELGGSEMQEPVDLFLGSNPVKDALEIVVIHPPLVKTVDVYDSETTKDY